MSAAFQTIPTEDPSESAFVITIDDTVINPTNIPVAGTLFSAWELGQKFRDDSDLWADYVFVDAINASPGRRAFVFGKKKTAAQRDVPFETYHDSEMYQWPAVVEKIRNIVTEEASGNVFAYNNYAIKSATNFESTTKIERFQNTDPWPIESLRHMKPIPDELILNSTTQPVTCLHKEIRLDFVDGYQGDKGSFAKNDPLRKPQLVYPATNFTDWYPFVIRDGQKKSNGLWVREKVTIYPPVQKTRKFF